MHDYCIMGSYPVPVFLGPICYKAAEDSTMCSVSGKMRDKGSRTLKMERLEW